MAEFPALPFFTDAYFGDTRHLTTIQHGAYLLLLFTAWRMPDCSLPDDDERLAKWAGMDSRTWARHKPTVMAFWKFGDDQRWRQGRLSDERKYVEVKSNKNSAAANAKWKKIKDRHDANAYAKTVPEVSQPTPTPTPTPTEVLLNLEEVPVNIANYAPNGANRHTRKRARSRTTADVRKDLGIRLEWFNALASVHPAGHDGIKPAMEAFASKVSPDEVGHRLAQDMYRAAKQYAARCKEDPTIKIKWLQGWINDERWTDENRLPLNGNGVSRADVKREEVTRGIELLGAIRSQGNVR